MRQRWPRASRSRFLLVIAAVSVTMLAASSPIHSAVRGSHVTRHTAASSLVAGGGVLTASRFGKGFAEIAPGKIMIARKDGSGSRILAKGWWSTVSPDGSRVAVIDSDVADNQATNWRLELFASAGGTPAHVIALECGPVYWSPDSTKLAFVALAGESEELLVVDAATAARTTLATG